MVNTLLKKIFVCLLYLVFVQALLAGDLALVRKGCAGAGKAGPCVLSFDVCGHGHASGAFGGAGFMAVIPDNPSFIPCIPNDFPPNPADAVATAEPGETGKPPKFLRSFF